MLKPMTTPKALSILFGSLITFLGVSTANAQSRVEAARQRERELTERLQKAERANPDSVNVDRLAQAAAEAKQERERLERQERRQADNDWKGVATGHWNAEQRDRANERDRQQARERQQAEGRRQADNDWRGVATGHWNAEQRDRADEMDRQQARERRQRYRETGPAAAPHAPNHSPGASVSVRPDGLAIRLDGRALRNGLTIPGSRAIAQNIINAMENRCGGCYDIDVERLAWQIRIHSWGYLVPHERIQRHANPVNVTWPELQRSVRRDYYRRRGGFYRSPYYR